MSGTRPGRELTRTELAELMTQLAGHSKGNTAPFLEVENIDKWRNALCESGVSLETIKKEFDRRLNKEAEWFPAVEEFIRSAKPVVGGQDWTPPKEYHECACQTCKTVYCVPTTQRQWTCGYCHIMHLTVNTKINYHDPNAKKLTNEEVHTIVQGIKNLIDGTPDKKSSMSRLGAIVAHEPTYDKTTEIARLSNALKPLKLERERLDKWAAWAKAPATNAAEIHRAAVQIETDYAKGVAQ